ncbi:MAG: gamma-glutamyltransferase [Xanthomonadales bacterium]|nr:gamma-glutamyltransferase [Xanthomonadales bacterium]
MGQVSQADSRGRSLKAHLCLIAIFAFFIQPLQADQPGKAAIASAHYLATEAGHEVLAKGGNAFDAAVAVGAVLAVVEQTSSGVGGGGFWVLHRASDGFEVMIDGREMAPGRAHTDMYLDANGEVDRDLALNGPLAAAIPGEIAGWDHLASHYGKLPLAVSLQPAIRIAREGYPVYTKFYGMLKRSEKSMRRWPAATAAFLPNGKLPEMGQVIKLPDLANILEIVAQEGRDGFYKGEVAQRLVDGVNSAGGIWSMADLEAYTIKERAPIRTMYHGYELVTAPPPSSGGIAIAEILNILGPVDLSKLDKAHRTHLIVEAMRRAYRDRALYLGDPDFYPVPVEMLTDPNYAAGLRAGIMFDKATPSSMIPGREKPPEGTDTSHFSIMDAEGNMVSATLTVNTPFGSKFMVPGTGFVLNNEMDDFSAKPGEPNAYGLIGFTANEIQPHKRPLSSMSPTLMIGEDRVAAIGTPGGSRIITMVLLGILDFMDGNEPESWVALPRYHHQYLPDKVFAEPDAFNAEDVAALEAMGHTVQVGERRWGNMHGVMWDQKTGEVTAGSDARSDAGKAIVR